MSGRIAVIGAGQIGVVALSLLAWAALWLMSVATPLAGMPVPDLIAAWRTLCGVGALDASRGLLFGMWSLMAVAMMLPTALPLVAAYRELPLARAGRVPALPWLLAGYLLAWCGFALVATVLQTLLARIGLLTVSGASTSQLLDTALLGMAGAYQFSALRAACLSRCRMPLAFLMTHWRDGRVGALGMGLRHGLDCVGCCWALMLLAFVGGTMNLLWMGVAMLLMTLEKLPAVGRHLTRPLVVVLLLAAAWGGGRALAEWL